MNQGSLPFRAGAELSLKVGPYVGQAYTMASFKHCKNSNGSSAVTRIVMTWFKFGRTVMAPI
jgi:hypothetical protein